MSLKDSMKDEVVVDELVEKKDPKKELRESIVEEVQSLTEDHKLSEIFMSIRDLSFSRIIPMSVGKKIVRTLHQPVDIVDYIISQIGKQLRKNEAILVEGKLQDFIEEIVKKYSVKEVEGIIDDLSDEKSFFKALKEMDIESGDDDIDFNEEGIDDDQDMALKQRALNLVIMMTRLEFSNNLLASIVKAMFSLVILKKKLLCFKSDLTQFGWNNSSC